MDHVRAIADAVLYEGYVLWPYRRSALKNQRRWTFGGVFPPAHSARHPDDRSRVRAEVLVEGDGDVLVSARFLHVVERRPAALRDGGLEEVDELEAAGVRHVAWDEATERVLGPGAFSVAAGESAEVVEGGAVIRRWRAIEGSVDVQRTGDRVVAELRNTTSFNGEDREDALHQSLCSAHLVLRAGTGARLVSQQDPPAHLARATLALRNEGLWPVLVGEAGSADTVLASPFILEDHPRVSEDSPGDFFDGGEIDQMLVLNVLALTDDEKEQMRSSDPRTREMLERTEALTDDQRMALYGAVRELGMTR